MASAVSLYVKSGIASGTAAPVPLAASTGLVVCRRIDKNRPIFTQKKRLGFWCHYVLVILWQAFTLTYQQVVIDNRIIDINFWKSMAATRHGMIAST